MVAKRLYIILLLYLPFIYMYLEHIWLVQWRFNEIMHTVHMYHIHYVVNVIVKPELARLFRRDNLCMKNGHNV